MRAADTLPEGYTRLEYAKTTGTQYFDTGFYPCPGTKMDASILIEMTNRGANLSGCWSIRKTGTSHSAGRLP